MSQGVAVIAIEPKRLSLDDQLCFALYAATNAVTRSYRPLLDSIGLTYPQYLVMLVLWQDGESTSRRISARLSLPPNAITPLIDRLEDSGFVRRRRDTQDRRVVHISPTTTGAELEREASLAQQDVECQTRLNQEDLAALREELKSLVLRMEPEAAIVLQSAKE